jgi:hypothetical protein
MTGIMAFLLRVLTGPLVGAVVDIVKTAQLKGLTEAQIKAEVEKAMLLAATTAHAQQIDLLKAEIQSEDPWVRRWRPCVAVAFACVLLWYAIFVPIAVDWYGFPPLRVGDKLLEWIVTLLGGTLGAFTIGRTIEKVASSFRR